MKVNTETVHFKADVELMNYVDKKVGKLEHFFDRIVDAQVMLKLENSGQVRDKISEIVIRVPGETIVCKESHKTFEASIDAACANLKRQLIKYKEKMRAKA